MPKKSRAGGGTPAGKRATKSGLSSPNSDQPAVQEECEIFQEDLEAGSEAIQAIQSSNASSQVKERVTALGSKFLAQREQIQLLRAAEADLRAELEEARRRSAAETPSRPERSARGADSPAPGYETALEDSDGEVFSECEPEPEVESSGSRKQVAGAAAGAAPVRLVTGGVLVRSGNRASSQSGRAKAQGGVSSESDQSRRQERGSEAEEGEEQEAAEIQRARSSGRQPSKSAGGGRAYRDSDDFDDPFGAFDPDGDDWGGGPGKSTADGYVKESGVPYIYEPSLPRPRRLFDQQERQHFIEACNLFRRGEYEEVLLGFDKLSVAAQYELEYVAPILGRVNDVREELARLNRHSRGRIPEAVLAELDAILDLGDERYQGNRDRARAAAGHRSRGHGVDQALQLMLDVRDDRIDEGEFTGRYGAQRRAQSDRIRRAEASLQAKAWALASTGWGRGNRQQQQQQQQQKSHWEQVDEAENKAATGSSKGSNSGGKGRGRGRGRGGK